jgi:hypothetical protein
MTYIEAYVHGIDLPVHLQDQLETHLADLFEYVAGDTIRSDVRINLWDPIEVFGGELTEIEHDALIDTLAQAVHAVTGPFKSDSQPYILIHIYPESAVQEMEKLIADFREQIAEHERKLEKYKDNPETIAQLRNDIERTESIIEDLKAQLKDMLDGKDDLGI